MFFNKISRKSIIKAEFIHVSMAVKMNDYEQVVVNHAKGFRNDDCHTTNTIEGMWSLLKYDMKGIKVF